MSLDWNTTTCPGNKVTAGWVTSSEPTKHQIIHPDTNSLCWGAFCGVYLSHISVKNIDEWIWRIEFLKRVDKPWMSDGSYPDLVALDDHLGFRTNCDGKTRKQWLKHISECLSDEVSKNIDKRYMSEEHVHAVNM